jgi:putative membrane protein
MQGGIVMMLEDGIGWWWLFNWLFILLFGTGFIALIIWVITRMGKGSSSATGSSNALDIAKERYAKGEISREEFEQIKKDLS